MRKHHQTTGAITHITFVAIVLLLPLPRKLPEQQSLFAAPPQNNREIKLYGNDKSSASTLMEEINARGKLAQLRDLKSATLGKDDLELRVWIGFGAVPLEGFVIKRRSRDWYGTHLKPIIPKLAPRDFQKVLATPKSGWEGFWQRLVEHGVLTLPEYGGILVTDGESVVIETRNGALYKICRYDNPDLGKSTEAREVIEIITTIRSEFGIPR